MISHQYKCIFIHIPKCAGTSIERVLGHLDHHTGRGGQDHRTIRMIERPLLTPHIFSPTENLYEFLRRLRFRARTVSNPNNKLTVTKKQYNEYYKFAIVRNPWARAFSWYQNVMHDEIHRRDHHITGDLSLKEFLRRFAGKGILRPQTHWLKSFDGSIKLDYVARFETLAEDFQKICRDLHIPPVELPHEIKGTGRDYCEFYDAESISLVSEVYGEEIAMFNYSFRGQG